MMVGLDIDGVLADFISPFLRVLEMRVGNGAITPATVMDLNFEKHAFVTEQAVLECIEEVSNDPAFWQELAPLPSSEHWKALEALSRQQTLVFVTHRHERQSYSIQQVTRNWLKKHGVSDPVVYFTQTYKSELIRKLKIDLFVDDRHENCRDAAENTEALVLMPHRSYNQTFNHPRVRRIPDLDALFGYLD
jgi:uncharacterized HAD superfamily protein